MKRKNLFALVLAVALPVCSCGWAENGMIKQFDQRSLAAKRRKQALSKATDVMLDMLKAAIKAGHSAKYVLFDTWFSNPKDIIRIHSECGMNTIAMKEI